MLGKQDQTKCLGVTSTKLTLLGDLSIEQFNRNWLNTYYVLSAKNVAVDKQDRHLSYRANILYKPVTPTLVGLFQNARKLTRELQIGSTFYLRAFLWNNNHLNLLWQFCSYECRKLARVKCERGSILQSLQFPSSALRLSNTLCLENGHGFPIISFSNRSPLFQPWTCISGYFD